MISLSPSEQFVAGAIVLTTLALFVAAALGSLAGWWTGRDDGREPGDLDWDEYRDHIPRQRDGRRP